MAVAALQILDLTDRIAETLPLDEFVPAVGQGCVAVEMPRRRRREPPSWSRAVDHAATRHAVEVERAFLAELGSGCSLPVAAHAADGVLHTFLADPVRNLAVGDVLDLDGNDDDLETRGRRSTSGERGALR